MNQSQYEAIHFADGALLLLAGPGSGKTFVITHRIKYLINELGVSPEKILVITFTKAAAFEMQERFKRLSSSSNGVVFGTFHAVFYQILRTLPKYRDLSLISEKDKLKLIHEILHQLDLEQYARDQSYTGILKQLSKYKNDSGAVYDLMEDCMEPDTFRRFLDLYQTLLKEMGKLDFDDMVLLCHDMLKENRELLAFWQNRFDYVMIDEFQDINVLQYEVMKLLTGTKNNLFAVGDDDQSIYGFRGADPVIMQKFLKEYEGAGQICLSHNYRSREEIIKAADQIIKRNKKRFDKEVLSVRGSGGLVRVIESESTQTEMNRMAVQIKKILKEGTAASETAILCRTNRELQAVVPYLNRAGIAYRGASKGDRLFKQEYITAIAAYFSYLAGDHSRGNFYQFMNRPLRYIKRDAVPEGEVAEKAIRAYYRDNFRMQDTVAALFAHLGRMERMKPVLALHYIRNVIGLDRFVKEQEKEESYRQYTEACRMLKNAISDCESFQDVREAVENRKACPGQTDNKDGISLLTYHASKGLEFTAVFLPELIEGRVPPRQAKTADQIEEERRMFYVAVTRARDSLYLYTVSNEREGASRFLDPLIR